MDEADLAAQILMLRAQFAALTELLKEVHDGDGGFIMNPSRQDRFEELYDYHLRKMQTSSGMELG